MRCQDVRTYVRKALRSSGKAGFGCSDMRRCGLRAFGLRGLAFGRPRFGRFCRTKIGHGNFTPLFCDLMVHFHLPAVAESLNYGFSVHVVAQSLNYGFSLKYGIMAALVPYLMYQRPNAQMLGLEWNCMCSCAIGGFACVEPKWYTYLWASRHTPPPPRPASIPQRSGCLSSSSSSFPRRQSSIKDAEDPVEISSEDGDGDDDEEADPVGPPRVRARCLKGLTEE